VNILRRRRQPDQEQLDDSKRRLLDLDERIRRLREVKAIIVIRQRPLKA
jgi:hypothetical protein